MSISAFGDERYLVTSAGIKLIDSGVGDPIFNFKAINKYFDFLYKQQASGSIADN